MYMLIKARILKKQGDLQEAVNCLNTAMALPGVRTGGGKKSFLVNLSLLLFIAMLLLMLLLLLLLLYMSVYST